MSQPEAPGGSFKIGIDVQIALQYHGKARHHAVGCGPVLHQGDKPRHIGRPGADEPGGTQSYKGVDHDLRSDPHPIISLGGEVHALRRAGARAGCRHHPLTESLPQGPQPVLVIRQHEDRPAGVDRVKLPDQ